MKVRVRLDTFGGHGIEYALGNDYVSGTWLPAGHISRKEDEDFTEAEAVGTQLDHEEILCCYTENYG